MPKKINKNFDVVAGAVPNPDEVGYTSHNDPAIMPRKGPANSPGSDVNDTSEFTTNAGSPRGNTNVFKSK